MFLRNRLHVYSTQRRKGTEIFIFELLRDKEAAMWIARHSQNKFLCISTALRLEIKKNIPKNLTSRFRGSIFAVPTREDAGDGGRDDTLMRRK